MAAPVVWEDISMANLLTLEILSGYTRPVINIGEDITCLIDSGSDTPVWTQGADRLLDSFAVEKVEGKKFFLSGFGTGHEIVDVYTIHDIILESPSEEGIQGDRIVFKNMTVACTLRPSMVADLILPATAFSHMNYTIRNLDVESPCVEIEHKKEEYYVNPIYNNTDSRFVERVYSFVSE